MVVLKIEVILIFIIDAEIQDRTSSFFFALDRSKHQGDTSAFCNEGIQDGGGSALVAFPNSPRLPL